ncbi:hypothetical protein FRC01_003442 [Tulasnella sp. 417]|nr:hypothetical protein FRC01_003442 [Tulasnella sp. 417]
MVSQGAIPRLTNIMTSSASDNVRDTAAWALGNILGHPSIYRKLVLQEGFGLHSLRILGGACRKALLEPVSWAYDHLKPYIFVELNRLYPSVEESVESWTFVEQPRPPSDDVARPSPSRSSICTYSDQELRELLNASLAECLTTAILYMPDPSKV